MKTINCKACRARAKVNRYATPCPAHDDLKQRFHRLISSRGGIASAEKLTAEQRTERAKKAAAASVLKRRPLP